MKFCLVLENVAHPPITMATCVGDNRLLFSLWPGVSCWKQQDFGTNTCSRLGMASVWSAQLSDMSVPSHSSWCAHRLNQLHLEPRAGRTDQCPACSTTLNSGALFSLCYSNSSGWWVPIKKPGPGCLKSGIQKLLHPKFNLFSTVWEYVSLSLRFASQKDNICSHLRKFFGCKKQCLLSQAKYL